MVLGQPLDLAVDVRLDSADDPGNACFEADVFHGDGRVDSNRVRVIVVAGGQQQDVVVRIRSSVVVDEPVVGVVLRSLCGQKASRRYDFLTDFPVETRAAAVPTIIPPVVAAPAAAPAPAPMPEVSTSTPIAVPAPVRAPIARAPIVRSVPRATVAPIVKTPKPVAASKPAPAKESVAATHKPVVSPEAADHKPRLKLESAETPDDRLVQLKSSADLLAIPAENPQKRADAVAAWRELNHLPAENTQETQRLLALEAESKALKALLAKSEADFKLRIEKLENNRNDNSLVYSLLGLLLAAVAAAGFWWNRARQRGALGATDWSHHGESSTEELEPAASLSRPAPLTTQAPPNTFPGPDHDPEVDESLFDDLKKLTAATMPIKPTVPQRAATAASVRSLQTEDFLDVQQHADFFVSLGQYDQAIGVLKKSIAESVEVNPLVYLELLKIYHTLGRQTEYNQQREAFNRIFNCQAPAFAAFSDEGQGLESYPAVMRNIQDHWGTPKALDFIETCLFRGSAAAPTPMFDLAAYRELLLLYAMLKAVVSRDSRSGRSVDHRSSERAGSTSVQGALEPRVSQSMPLGESAQKDTSFTQPMLLMPERPNVPSEPVVPAYREPLDLDLDLNLDFSNSELAAMQKQAAVPAAAPVPAPEAGSTLAPLDLDLDDLLAGPAVVEPAPSPKPAIDSKMLELDLFDPSIEAKIAPKNK